MAEGEENIFKQLFERATSRKRAREEEIENELEASFISSLQKRIVETEDDWDFDWPLCDVPKKIVEQMEQAGFSVSSYHDENRGAMLHFTW